MGNPTFKCKDADTLLYGRPNFSIEPTDTAKAAIVQNGGKLTKEIVHEFIRSLMEASRECRVKQTCETLSGIDETTRKIFALQVIASANNSTAEGIGSTLPTPEQGPQSASGQNQRSSRRNASNTASADSVPSTQSTVVAEDDGDNAGTNSTHTSNDSGEIVPLNVGTKEVVPNRIAPVVSPVNSVGHVNNVNLERGTPLPDLIQIMHPRKGDHTVRLLRGNPKDPLTDWKHENNNRKKSVVKERRETKAMLHAASGSDLDFAAQILCDTLKGDDRLANTLLDKLGPALANYDAVQKLMQESPAEMIAEGIMGLCSDLHSNGSRHAEEQQVIDGLTAGAFYCAETDEQSKAVARRLKLRTRVRRKGQSIAKEVKAKKAAAATRVKYYSHHKRARRSNSKEDAARPFVYEYCHNNDYSRAAREDTGEFRKVRVLNPFSHKYEYHWLRRWEEHSATYKQLFEHWKKSDQAKKFRKKYPKLKDIGIKLFRKLLCPCCRFSMDLMCVDEAMSALEEARSAIFRVCMSKYFKEAIKLCECEFHANLGMNDLFCKRGDSIIENTLCNPSLRETLQRNPYPGPDSDSVSGAKTPKLNDFDCVNGRCKKCGVKNLMALIRKCPILCPDVPEDYVDDEDEEEGVPCDLPLDPGIESDDEGYDHDPEDQGNEDNANIENEDEDGAESDGEDDSDEDDRVGCDWKDVIGGGCVMKETRPSSTCGRCKCLTHHLCHLNYARHIALEEEEEGLRTRCSNCFLPSVQRHIPSNMNSEETLSDTTEDENNTTDVEDESSDDGTSSESESDTEMEETISASELRKGRLESKFAVKKWKYVDVDRTDRKQKELVQQMMTIHQLLDHFEECLEKAVKHWGRYKVVDWMIDMMKYNTKADHYRLVFFADYSASANLRARRTLNSTIDTHATIEVFIAYEYKTITEKNEAGQEVEREVCTKRSHIFIGSAKSSMKNNDWQFHIACARHLVKEYKDRRGDHWPVKEVVFITDRCPTQYLCRQNLLQLALASKEDEFPLMKHLFQCASRGKGDCDADSRVIKDGIRTSVRCGEEGTTAWDFFVATVNNYEKSEMNPDDVANHLHERLIYFVDYNEDDFNEHDVGDHKGKIVLANLNIDDDTDPVSGSTTIYAVEALPDFKVTSYEQIVDLNSVHEVLYELEHKESDHLDDDEFLSKYNEDRDKLRDEFTPRPFEIARYDFLQIQRGLLPQDLVQESLNSLGDECDKSEYRKEFVIRCGKETGLNSRSSNETKLNQWLAATPIERLWVLRSSKRLVQCYKATFQTNDSPPSKKKSEIVGCILGIDLPDFPKRPKTDKELYRCSMKKQTKEQHPSMRDAEITALLNDKFLELTEEEKERWRNEEKIDKERYDKELKDVWKVDDDDNICYMRVYRLSCGCEECLANRPDKCKSPFKQEMRPRIIRLVRRKKKKRQGEEEEEVEYDDDFIA